MLTRTEKSVRNIKYAIIGQFFGIIINFVSRFVFIKTLPIDYLGLGSLFTNILTIFSLTELGVGAAMSYQLYKPLADNDTDKIKALMFLYKKIYIIISLIILILGILCLPVYPYLINDIPNIENLNYIYILFVLNTAFSYWFAYKRILVNADQKQYITTYFKYLFYFILNILQIIELLLLKNYILFLCIQIFMTFVENVSLSIKVNKMYPYLKEKSYQKLSKDIINEMFSNVKSIFFHRFGGVVLSSTDNIVISKMLGLGTVALYSNYMLIINALNSIIYQFFNSIVASIGNLDVTSGRKRMTKVFDKLFFLGFWIHIVCFICLLCLLNPFIEIWLGVEYIVDFSVVLALTINFYLFGMRRVAMAFREATGNFYDDRFSPIIEAVLNIFFSIVLSKYIGLMGVVIGTVISCVCTNLWLEPLVVCRKSLDKSLKDYFKIYFCYTFIGLIITFITFFVASFINVSNFGTFIFKAIIVFMIPNICLIFVFKKDESFIYYLQLFKRLLKIKCV